MSQAPSSEPRACRRACIFDIDNTVTVGQDHDPAACPVVPGPPPAWPQRNSGATQAVRDALAACYAQGYSIAFASAESRSEGNNEAQKRFVRSLDPTGGSLFTDAFFESPAYQNSWTVLAPTEETRGLEYGRKEAMFLNILRHLEIPPACFKHSVVFDDQTENLASAHELGLRSVQASPECGGFYCTEGCGIPAGALRLLSETS